MAISWTKTWSASDDGSILSGGDLGNIQSDIDSGAITSGGVQTLTGNKTFSGTVTLSGVLALTNANTYAAASDINTGTMTTKPMVPDTFAGSNFGRRCIIFKVIADDEVLTTGDGKYYITIPPELNGMNLVDADAHVYTVSSGAAPSIAIYNFTDSQDVLSVNITIDASENDSSTAATGCTINTSYDDVATADVYRIDVDVAGTGTKGLELRLSFQLP